MKEEIIRYVDLRCEELKLKTVNVLSDILGRIIWTFLMAFLLIVTVMFIILVLAHYMNGLLGEPWGTLLAAVVLALVIILMMALRTRLLRVILNRIFAEAVKLSSNDIPGDIVRVEKEIEQAKNDISERYEALMSECTTALSIIKVIRSILKKAKTAS